MLNQVVFVGRIHKIKEIENGLKLLVKVPRSYKNEDGEYDNDFIPVTLTGNIAKNTLEYCGLDDLIGIKGCLESQDCNLTIRADKVTFLSCKSKEN